MKQRIKIKQYKKQVNNILDNKPFNYFIKHLINWYVEEFDNTYNKIVYDYTLHRIK